MYWFIKHAMYWFTGKWYRDLLHQWPALSGLCHFHFKINIFKINMLQPGFTNLVPPSSFETYRRKQIKVCYLLVTNPGTLYAVFLFLSLSCLWLLAITNLKTLILGFVPQVCTVSGATACSHWWPFLLLLFAGPPNHHSQSTLRPPLPPPHNHTLSHHHSSANSLNRNSLTNRRSQIHAPAPAPNDLATTPESVQLQDSWVLNSNVPLETR